MNAYQVQVDPTNVSGKRVVAVIIDWAIAFVVSFGLFFALADSADTGGFIGCGDISGYNQCVTLGDTIYVVEGSNATVLTALQWAYLIGIFVVLRGLTGRTPGTMALGLRCVDEQGQNIGIGRGFLRSIAGIVDYIPCCFPLVGTITIFTTKGHRRVGDMAAKTFMIDAEHAGQPVVVPGVTTPAAGAPAAGGYGAPPAAGYGAPAPGTGYGAPTAPAPTAPQPTPTGEPQWDPQRNTYIQWDATRQQWLQWNETTQQWTVIE